MDIQDILATVDHTLLNPAATWEDIRALCDDGMRYHTASVCIPPNFVSRAADYVNGALPICTVIGFPNGNATTAVKCFETDDAVKNGASEIDMVIPIGWVKEGRFDDVQLQIHAIKRACKDALLKVIIETCRLTKEEIVRLCAVVSASGADYIKTSTGFSTGGATREDVALMVASVSNGVKVKAAGGIRSLADAEDFLRIGAARLGTSTIVKIVKEEGLL